MKMICAPSQVMREGRDLNQHGQAGRQEQASSSSPVTFHEVLGAAATVAPEIPSALMPHRIAIETTDLVVVFIDCFSRLKRVGLFMANLIPRSEWSTCKVINCMDRAEFWGTQFGALLRTLATRSVR